jgi:hypothetical protein
MQYVDRDGAVVAAASDGLLAGLSPSDILRGWKGVPCWAVAVTHSLVSLASIEEQQVAIAEVVGEEQRRVVESVHTDDELNVEGTTARACSAAVSSLLACF